MIRSSLLANDGQSIQAARRQLERNPISHPAMNKVESRQQQIKDIPCTLVSPKSGGDKPVVLVYFHGGGYAVGSTKVYAGLLAQLAVNSDCLVIAPDYALAPEHPFPKPQHDCLEVAKAVINGYPDHRIVLAGDSAGGGLVLNAALGLRGLDLLDQVDALVLLSPWIDPSAEGGSMQSNLATDTLNIDFLNKCVESLMQGGAADDAGICFKDADLHALPRTLIQYGGSEIFADQIAQFSQHAEQSSIDLKTECYQSQFHVFHVGSLLVKDAKQAMQSIASFVG